MNIPRSPILSADTENLELAEIKAGDTIDSSVFENIELSGATLKKVSVTDCVFNNCLLFGNDLDGSWLRRIRFKSGMYSGIVLSDSTLTDILFTGVKLNLSNFRTSRFQRVEFDNCDLSEADFQGASFTAVSFKNCDLSGADFSHCKMTDVDMRNSKIASVKGLAGLRGATIDTAQLMSVAHGLAAEMGIKVDD
jgi:uncharacterized protein YjbI with pentapeptide repeats